MTDEKLSPAVQGIPFHIPTAIQKMGRVEVTPAAIDACGRMRPSASGR